MSNLKPKEKLQLMINFYEGIAKEKNIKLSKGNLKNSLRYENIYNTTTELVFLAKKSPLNELIEVVSKNKRDSINTQIRFFKDYENFFVRMVQTNISKRENKSLKNYRGRIDKIIALNNLERFTLFGFDKFLMRNFNTKHLENLKIFYYQPKTARLNEGIRTFKPEPVIFDYTHKMNLNPRIKLNQEELSKTYFFLEEILNN